MLGKLFNLTSGTVGGASAQQTSPSIKLPPESVQEDIHTRSLLFPDTQELFHREDQLFPLPVSTALQSGSQTSTYDYDKDVDFDVRDVRVIIMQDTLGNVNPSLLFDSHPGPTPERPTPSAATPSPFAPQDSRRTPVSPRKGSQGQTTRPLAIQPGSPQPRQGAFDRRGSIQSRAYSFAETELQRASREYREELASFSSCIFANTEVMAYKGTSTKVHVIPSENRSTIIPSSYAADGRGSLGRSSMRSSRLAQSFTLEPAHTQPSTHAHGRIADRKKILVTRLFPVNLPSDDLETPHGVAEDNTGFPFPYSPDETKPKRKKPKPVSKRTPMYAVALVIPLPANPTNSTNPGTTAPKPTFRASSSFNEPDAFPSSLGSARRAGWSMIGSGYGSESFESYLSSDGEDRMDFITQHWDIIMRTLTHLQSVVAGVLYPMLKQADSSAPDPYPINAPIQLGRAAPVHSRRGSDASQVKLPKQYAKLVTLPPNALMQDQQTSEEVENAQLRIVTGLCATRVVTGQGRWGPWREEARWVARWAGSKEQGFFFFNLLTGFLATHTDWLQALSPIWYRRRYYQQQKAKSEEDTSLPSRTVIIANDKMAARRLIFLLSAFLPANQQLPTVRAQRPTTSASFGAFSHSPPSYIVPINKEESLRRKINRRQGQRAPSHTRSFSIQSQATTRSMTGIPAQLAHLSIDNQQHERRSSDFFKPAQLTMAGSDLNTRKSSAATTNTVLPDEAVAHFSTTQRSSDRVVRPDNRSSVAADDLKRSLTRVNSLGHSSRASTHSRQSSRWGSVISGFWGAKRRDSTASTYQTPDTSALYDSPIESPIKKDVPSSVARQAESMRTETNNEPGASGTAEDEPDTPRRQVAKQLEPQIRVPDPSGAFESPVKTSINNDDGVIDVDVQFPDYLTSFETAVSSPSSSGYLSTPGLGSALDSFEQFSRLAIDGDAPLNVAGWLQSYHSDFTLQAIPPQKDILDQVRESLRAEPTPTVHPNAISDEWPMEQWVDVSSAIIADTTTFSIKQLRYRRLVRPRATADRNTGSSNPYSSLGTPALSPFEQPIEEKFEEEELVTLDEALIDAVERVIAQTNDSSRVTSATSSRSVSKRRGRSNSEASEPEQIAPDVRLDFQEVPRVECKTVVLSALGSIVQDVIDKREKESQKNANQNVGYQASREKESALRGAIRAWLDNVELGDG
ncbi:folliculin-interacting protein N-terminus-domain-containing protein [Xylaria flabelliformis]|nr:folliculin-interacting protein N-terminus-domain-containing protein [Xylaria flabelliformis]